MDLITVTEMDDLPDDPATAFVQLERICRTRLNDYVAQTERYEHGDDIRLEYMTVVASAAQAYGVADLGDPDDFTNDHFRTLYQRAMAVATRLAIAGKQARALDSVTIPSANKERLRSHLGILRTALEGADIGERKKRILTERLNDFEKELDKAKSNVTKILASVALVAAAINQTAKGIVGGEDVVIKLPETINAVNILLGREKLRELEAAPDPLPLPPKPETKKLPSPSSRGAFGSVARSAGGFSDDLDDDVPF